MLTPTRPLAIAMWDFSWLERRWDGAGYEDWDVALGQLVDRGYDAVRIDAYPHLVHAGPHRAWELVPVWDQEDWGAQEPVTVTVLPALLDFLLACRRHGVVVMLSSWFRQDPDDVRMRLTTPDALADAWSDVLTAIDGAGLSDVVYLVDLGNEWPHPLWVPFLYPEGTSARRQPRGTPWVSAWARAALTAIRERHPAHRYLFSFSQEPWGSPGEDVTAFDVLDLHAWFTAHPDSTFYRTLGYEIGSSRFDPLAYRRLSGPAERLYRSDPGHWRGQLRELVAGCAAYSRRVGKPLISTECWAVVNYKDGPGRDWGWIKELCALGVRTASATGRWEAIATSNFCGPQFVGMWRDVEWHRQLTSAIHDGALPDQSHP